MKPLAKVLLVEDDAMLRQFVRMALEETPVELLECASVASALTTLRERGPVALVITDLMMPGQTGWDLIRHLQSAPQLLSEARITVLSAGVNTATREELVALGAWRVLLKPVSVAELAQCVSEALHERRLSVPLPVPARPSMRQGTVEQYFAGNEALFASYLASCKRQFSRDMEAGDLSAAAIDLVSLRLLAHSLKAVLSTLGYDSLSECARSLETLCQTGNRLDAVIQWSKLRADLSTLAVTDSP